MAVPPGLFWDNNFLNAQELAQVEQLLTREPYFPVPTRFGKVGQNPRYAVHYGFYYPYVYGAKSFDPQCGYPFGVCGRSLENCAPPLPNWLAQLRERVIWLLQKMQYPRTTLQLSAQDTFNQCIINKYPPQQGISAHTDDARYGPIVVSITTGAAGKMIFKHPQQPDFELTPPPGSIYIMSGPARYEWMHEMPKLSARATGERISITFRSK